MTTDIEIARAATLHPIADIAAKVGLSRADLDPQGHHIAKLTPATLAALRTKPRGKLILVTAINPTPAGEGKTTTTIGLGDALNHIGRTAMIALREPSLGPVFGRKGGATGGGQSQVLPMERINLHFTGDFHAITSAHNLLAALIDNALHYRLPTATGLPLDARHISWRRVLDMNDRALRTIATGLGATVNGPARETGFDITVASEVMAILCLATDLADLQSRLARIRIGRDEAGTPVTAGDIDSQGAMTALLVDAILPNLVQSIGGSPALIHGGPFANIAHGCNSVAATAAALALADFTVTEAGFGADLGAEKFCNIKCRVAGLEPAVAVIVATVRALKYHGGAALADLGTENPEILAAGLANLSRHVENMARFGIPVVVAPNAFTTDTAAEHATVIAHCRDTLDVEAHVCRHWAEGAPGAEALAHSVAALADANTARFRPLYPDHLPLDEKLRTIAHDIYRAADIALTPAAARQLKTFTDQGFGHLPVCMAKTPYSFTADEHIRGATSGHLLPIREIRLAAGAGFIIALCGDINTMPGLPRTPAANHIGVDASGQIIGLD